MTLSFERLLVKLGVLVVLAYSCMSCEKEVVYIQNTREYITENSASIQIEGIWDSIQYSEMYTTSISKIYPTYEMVELPYFDPPVTCTEISVPLFSANNFNNWFLVAVYLDTNFVVSGIGGRWSYVLESSNATVRPILGNPEFYGISPFVNNEKSFMVDNQGIIKDGGFESAVYDKETGIVSIEGFFMDYFISENYTSNIKANIKLKVYENETYRLEMY